MMTRENKLNNKINQILQHFEVPMTLISIAWNNRFKYIIKVIFSIYCQQQIFEPA